MVVILPPLLSQEDFWVIYIFIIAELTNGYTLFVPLMLISAISYFVKLKWDSTPAYFNQTGFKEFKQTYKEWAFMNEINIQSLINRNYVGLSENATLRESIQEMGASRADVFPVLKNGNTLVGVILIDDIRPLLLDSSNYDKVQLKTIMHVPSEFIKFEDSVELIMEKFDITESRILPVVDKDQFIGFLDKSALLSAYRNVLRLSDDVL